MNGPDIVTWSVFVIAVVEVIKLVVGLSGRGWPRP